MNILISFTDLGKLMARYCIAFDTMKKVSKVTGSEDINELVSRIIYV